MFFSSGGQIPQKDEVIFVEYAAKQTVEGLDDAAQTTVRDDHEDFLVVGAAGRTAMMRASGITESGGIALRRPAPLCFGVNSSIAAFWIFSLKSAANRRLMYSLIVIGSWINGMVSNGQLGTGNRRL